MAQSKSKRVPKYRRQRRPNGADHAFVMIDGQRVYLGRYGSEASKEKYARLLAEANRSKQTVTPRGDGVTVNDCLAAYWTFATGYYVKNGAPTVEIQKIREAGRIVAKLYGSALAAHFGPLDLKTCRQAFIDKGNCRRLVNEHTIRIRRILRWCAGEEMIPAAVCDGLATVDGLKRGRTEAQDRPPIKPVPDEYVEALERHLPPTLWAAVQVQRLTGMRSAELLSMRACDIDATGTVWIYKPESHKTEHHGYERIVDIGPRAQKIIEPLLKPDLSAYLFDPRDAVRERAAEAETHRRPGQPASPRKTERRVGDRYDVAAYRRAIARACKQAGVPHWHPHQLRHNYATAVRRQYGIETARNLLGHKSIDVTAIYAESDRKTARRIVEKIG